MNCQLSKHFRVHDLGVEVVGKGGEVGEGCMQLGRFYVQLNTHCNI